MNTRKIITLAAVLSLAVSLASGCGGTPSPSGSTASTTFAAQASTQASQSAAQTPASDSSADWLPSGEKPVLRQLGINQADDYNTYPVAKDIEELTGYHVEYDMLPSESAMDKLNLIMASGEDYDIVVIGGDMQRVMEYATQGALTDINPYLQYAPNLDAAISGYERETFTLNDGLYAIGMTQLEFDGHGDVRSVLWMRGDWMEKLGLSVPKTTEELVEALRAFKTYENGSGSASIPMTISSGGIIIDGIVGAFGLPLAWNEVDGQLVYRGADPRFQDYLNFMKSLYQEGLLDAEFPANQGANIKEKYTGGIAGSCPFGFFDAPSVFSTMEQTQPDQKTIYLPPLKGPNGDQSIGTNSGGFDRIAFIPKTCQNVEHVINFMNIKLEPEIFEILTIGKEGVHFTTDESGDRWPITPIFFDERGQANNYSTGRYVELYPDMWQVRNRKDPRQYECWKTINSPEFLNYMVNSEVNKAPAFPETSKNKQSLDQMMTDQHIKIIAGTETTDTYDAFLESWMAAGGEAMIKEYNDWYAEFKK